MKDSELASMKNMALAVLESPITKHKIAFRVGMVFIGPNYYTRVHDAVKNGDIEMKFSSKMNHAAKYSPKKDRLTVGFKKTNGNSDREALLLHELTHAAHDIRGISRSVLHSEASAYIAQVLYFYYRHESVFKAGEMAPSFGDKILRAAWDVSKLARKQPCVVSDIEAQPLFNAIKTHKLYKNTHDGEYDFDGV